MTVPIRAHHHRRGERTAQIQPTSGDTVRGDLTVGASSDHERDVKSTDGTASMSVVADAGRRFGGDFKEQQREYCSCHHGRWGASLTLQQGRSSCS